jgi:hypothetical protein
VQDGGPVDPVGREVAQRVVGAVERVGRGDHTDGDAGCDREELFAVAAGVGGDTDDVAFAEEVPLVGQARDVGERDPGDRERAS